MLTAEQYAAWADRLWRDPMLDARELARAFDSRRRWDYYLATEPEALSWHAEASHLVAEIEVPPWVRLFDMIGVVVCPVHIGVQGPNADKPHMLTSILPRDAGRARITLKPHDPETSK